MPVRLSDPAPPVSHATFTLGSTVMAGLGAVLMAGLALRMFVVGAVRVPSSSMENTLVPGDVVLVNKLAASHVFYPVLPLGTILDIPLRVPPLVRIAVGDVVMFRAPHLPVRHGQTPPYIVKRCIGTPGDVLRFEGGSVSVNGRPLRLPRTAVQAEAPAALYDAPTTIVVPEGAYFMMGDNAARSIDSRQWGAVPQGSIIGTAELIYWSLEPRAPWTGFPAVRWSRVGKVVL